MAGYILILLGSCLLSLLLLPRMARLMVRCGVVDSPDGGRKIHRGSIPRAGGITVLSSAAIILSGVLVYGDLEGWLLGIRFSIPGVVAAAGLMALIGFLDDRYQLRGRYKLLGQCAATLVAIMAGVRIDDIEAFGLHITLGTWAIPITAFWLLGAVNAFNLLDGMDGMAGSISTVVCLTLTMLAAAFGHPFIAAIALSLVGGLAGFLAYNLPPAKVFMGDCGSLTIGFLVGILAVEGCLKGATTVALAIPVALLTLPIMDTICAIIRRALTGRSIFCADRGHLHHRLLARGWSVRGVLALVVGLSCVLSLGALASVFLQNETAAIIALGSVVGILVLGRLFGEVELDLIRQRSAGLFSSVVSGRTRSGWEMAVRLQGSATCWGELWAAVRAEAKGLRVERVSLAVNVPQLHEAYYAQMQLAPPPAAGTDWWNVELPIQLGGRMIGKLRLASRSCRGCTLDTIATFADLVVNCEQQAENLTAAGRSVRGILPSGTGRVEMVSVGAVAG